MICIKHETANTHTYLVFHGSDYSFGAPIDFLGEIIDVEIDFPHVGSIPGSVMRNQATVNLSELVRQLQAE